MNKDKINNFIKGKDLSKAINLMKEYSDTDYSNIDNFINMYNMNLSVSKDEIYYWSEKEMLYSDSEILIDFLYRLSFIDLNINLKYNYKIEKIIEKVKTKFKSLDLNINLNLKVKQELVN